MYRDVMSAAPRVLALATLLAVGAQTLSTGSRHTASGIERYSKLDRFLHDRMGLPGVYGGGGVGNRSGPPAPTTRSAADVPEDEDDGNAADNEEDGDDDDDEPRDDDDEQDDDDELRDDDEQEDEEEALKSVVRLRHRTAAMEAAQRNFDVYHKDIQKQEPARTTSTVTRNKWDSLGSKDAVEKTFKRFFKKKTNTIQGVDKGGEISNHAMRISSEASCKVPRSRVIKVADVYPTTNKLYTPTCTVLHVCAEDTGCCDSPLKCGPKTSQRIDLPFMITLTVVEDWQSSKNRSYPESLSFYNHTECECQSRQDEMPKDTMPTTYVPKVQDPPPRPSFRHRPDKNNQYSQNSCKCPTEYSVRYLANGSCSCDCFDKQRECIRYKKGNVYFNHLDTYCITSGQCLLPMCEYGVYSSRTRRCPKQFETLYSLKYKKHYF